MKNSSGLTLTELLVVVAVIGILAVVAIPRMLPQTERARAAEAVAVLSTIRQGELAYREDRNQYLSISNAEIGVTAAVDTAWESIYLERNPNRASAQRFFTYSVAASGGPPTNAFVATATRTAIDNAGNTGSEANRTITLDQGGTWGGTYVFRPCNTGESSGCI